MYTWGKKGESSAQLASVSVFVTPPKYKQHINSVWLKACYERVILSKTLS